ncbi:conserved hypothetical protein [Leishmania braziliensis MHOM/BR/75/M2904]|uniref:Uncharacterized protein n=1 Tax=Leishmania braziliensis TaxID=5660 RepID=A4H881_LEIBR|nr:conserved hypothetical protein [Leishmania braziliensis MHOM/BR/75/M2904]CAJ2469426.1 unnamed protein product [Leishmania braziliensis]CAM42129.2 conserved hypothetical protein [Leishmania braziliensis MHOM/BR/75/M2904]
MCAFYSERPSMTARTDILCASSAMHLWWVWVCVVSAYPAAALRTASKLVDTVVIVRSLVRQLCAHFTYLLAAFFSPARALSTNHQTTVKGMPPIVQRTYKLGVGSTTDADAPASSASPSVVSSAPEEHVMTRTCHRWSYVDASRHESCIITLQAHYSLHVDVKAVGSTAAASSTQPMGGDAESPGSNDGLCGFAWEFIWVPSPCLLSDVANTATTAASSNGSISNPAGLEAQQPTRARFFFPRTTSLARSTLQGTGGVIFLSSRHVLVATEAPEAAGAGTEPAAALRRGSNNQLRDAAHYGLMDSFVLSSGDAVAIKPVSRSCSWLRIAASAALPCPFTAPQTPGRVSATSTPPSRPSTVLLLVAGVPLPLPHHTSAAAAEVPLMRLVYIFAALSSTSDTANVGSAHPQHRAWDVLACVADLFSNGASVDNPQPLQTRVRHTLTIPLLRLSGHRTSAEDSAHRGGGDTGWGHARCSADGENGTPSSSRPPPQPVSLDPPDLLWAFVEDADTRGVHLFHDGQLCGSLVALLPCSCAPARASVAPSLSTATASSRVASSALSPPVVLCMGFKRDAPYGALGVTSAELDSYAKAKQQQQQPRRTSHSSVQEIIEQLLPPPERAVYELTIGCPTTCIGPPTIVASGATAAESPETPMTVLPACTSLLMLIMDGIHTRNTSSSAERLAGASRTVSSPTTLAAATAPPQGLYLTETLPWDALALLACPESPKEAAGDGNWKKRIHHVPPMRTLWLGLDPVVLSPAPTSATGIVDGEYGDEHGVMQDVVQAAHRDVLAWDVADVGRWMEWLSEAAGGSADGMCVKDPYADPMASHSTAEAEGTTTSVSVSFMATVTAVESRVCASSSTSTADSAVRGFPYFNDLTHELTMLWYCGNGATGPMDEEKDQAATERVVALLRPSLWLPRTAASPQKEWEAHVAEWVAAEHVRGHLQSLTTPPSDAAVAAATYRAMRVLWAYAVLHETGPTLPQWPRVLMEVVRSTATDAPEHQTRLHYYARAIQTFTMEHLALQDGSDAATLEMEVCHMRRAAGVFLRLVLRTLVELDWCAGDVVGWMCCQWFARWFLGSGAVAAAAVSTRPPSPTATADISAVEAQAAAVEGRAMQALLQLGAAAPSPALSPPLPLDWLRRALLLFICRNTQRPLELTVDDILEASGVSLEPETRLEATQVAASTGPPWPTRDTAELRESIEYALLRLVKPEELYCVVHRLAQASPAIYLQNNSALTSAAGSHGHRGLQGLVVRGVLTVADLHALVCASWAPGRPHDATPPLGFTFVCCVVEAAMAFTSTVSPAATDTMAAAEAYERLAIAALDTWKAHDGYEDGRQVQGTSHAQTDVEDAADRMPVYPLLYTPELDGLTTAAATTVSAPFPFMLLPPLLTVYLWYHVAHRLCAALQLFPPAASQTTGARQPEKPPEADTTDEQQHAPWLRCAKLRDGDQLRALHRGVCVLRCLTQEDATGAEELFAAMRFVYSSSQRDSGYQCAPRQIEHAGMANGAGSTSATATASAASGSWVSQYLIAWQHLLSLEAPPMCSAGALLAYQERCCTAAASTASHAGDIMRALHLIYASSGSGRVLRAQLSRAMGLHQQVTNELATEEYAHSYAAFTCVLQSWRIAAQTQSHHSSTKLSMTTTAMCNEGAAATDVIAAWLVQVWVNVLLCSSGAVTDVGMYEHLFAALAPATQRGEQRSTAATAAAADVTFALLRPCLLYALPTLEQLAVEEDLGSSSGDGNRSPAPALSYPQYSEPLTWKASGTTPNGEKGPHRGCVPVRLCAGEVCERVRRQLRRLIALYNVPPSASPGIYSTQRRDVRFDTLARLMAMQPTLGNLAAAQRRIALRSVKQSVTRRVGDSDDRSGQRSAPMPFVAAAASGHSCSSSNSSSGAAAASSCDDSESALELRHFFLSPAAAYVTAAAAVAMDHAKNRASAGQDEKCRDFLLRQSPSAAPLQSVGWLVVACEVLRRELRCYILAEMRMNGYLEESVTAHTEEAVIGATPGNTTAEAPAPHLPCPLVPHWRLDISEAQLKAFINALADAVEPLTGALVEAMSFALLQPLLLLLVLDVLHGLLSNNAHTHEAEGVADEATQRNPAAKEASSSVVQCADASILLLLRQWIRGVAAPLYQRMEDAGKKVALQVLTDDFAREHLTTPRAEGAAASLGSGAPVSASYHDSDLHVKWSQWRNETAARNVNEKAAAMLECLSMCAAADHQQLVRTALPRLSHDEAPQQAVSAVSQDCLGAKTTGNSAVAAATAIGSTWLDAGSALRTSLFNTIGATVAPRAAHQHQQQHVRIPSSAVSSPRGEAQPATVSPVAVSLPSHIPQSQAVLGMHPRDSDGSRASGLAVAGTNELQLLFKEEAFKRRQCSGQLLHEQQQFFASLTFQSNLLQVYVALRIEKRRMELVDFALDQHDLIFALAHREQKLRFDDAREELRRAWCEWGERQRLAMRRLLQEERDARMGVQATDYAARHLLLDAERQERRLWVLYQEGRAGVIALEDDARDGLAMAAARAHLELTKRAAEAEEEAYWKEEEAIWERMQEEEQQETNWRPHQSLLAVQAEREGSRMSSSSWASSSSAAAAAAHPRVAHGDRARGVSDDNSAAALKNVRRGSRKGLGGSAAAVVPLHSSCSGVGQREASDAFTPTPVRAGVTAITSATVQPQPQQAPPHSASLVAHTTHLESDEDVGLYGGGGLAQAAVQSTISGAGSLLSALSQWQTALRETVAPTPPTRCRGRAMDRQAAVSDAATSSTAGQASVTVPIAKEVQPPTPVEVEPPELTTKEDATRAATVLSLPARRIIPLRRTSVDGKTSAAAPNEGLQQDTTVATGSGSAVGGGGTSVAGAVVTAKPLRRKKGFAAAAVLVKPVSSSGPAHGALQAPSFPLPLHQSVKQPCGQQHQQPPSPEAPAMLNPMRNILPGIEAAATEVLSEPTGAPSPVAQRENAPLQTQPQGSPSARAPHTDWSELSTVNHSSGRSSHSVPSPLCGPETPALTVAAALDTNERAEVQAGRETQSDPAALGPVCTARRAEDVANVAAADANEENAEMSPEVHIHGTKPAVKVGKAAAAAAMADDASSPAQFAPSSDAARVRRGLHSHTPLAGPLPLPGALIFRGVPLPSAGVGDDDWGWSDDDARIAVPTEGTCQLPPPQPTHNDYGVIAMPAAAAAAAAAPPPSAHLPNLSRSSAKGTWSRDDDSFGSDIAATAPDTAPHGVPSTPSGTVAAPTTRSAVLADLQEVYAAELEMREQLVELL